MHESAHTHTNLYMYIHTQPIHSHFLPQIADIHERFCSKKPRSETDNYPNSVKFLKMCLDERKTSELYC